MVQPPVVICPVDFSEASRGSLRYAIAVAEHFQATLTVLTVDHPLLDNAAATNWGAGWLEAQSTEQLEAFVKATARTHPVRVPRLEVVAVVGDPADAILNCAESRRADLIVMSSRGATGIHKTLFGSTAERVLRRTTIPVLVTPPADPGPDDLEDLRRSLGTVVAPLDLGNASAIQARIAAGVAEALAVPVVLVHVLETLPPHRADPLSVARIDRQRHDDAMEALTRIQRMLSARMSAGILVRQGHVGHEIATVAIERRAGAIVMLLGSSISHGIGSVTYRVLCEARTLVLALPVSIVAKFAQPKGRPHHDVTTDHAQSGSGPATPATMVHESGP